MRRACLTLLLVALSLRAAQAVVLDWNSPAVTWAPGSTSNSYDVDPSNAGNDVTISLTGNTNKFIADPTSGTQTPAITQTLQGGQAAGNQSLELAINLVPPNKIVVTIDFSANYALGVNNVTFSIFDIDTAPGSQQDLVRSIAGVGTDGNAYSATITNVGPSATLTGVGFAQTLSGNSDAPDTGVNSTAGNATISFGATPLRTITFIYDNTGSGPANQDIAISNLSFTPVPEVSPAWGGFCACAVVFGFKARRRRREKR